MNVGDLIKKTRMEKGLTQEMLAEKVGVKKSAVAKWENGRVSEIKRSNLKNLADALGLNPNELLDEHETKQPTIDDGLSDSQRKLIEFAKTVPEDKAAMILKVIQSIVEADG